MTPSITGGPHLLTHTGLVCSKQHGAGEENEAQELNEVQELMRPKSYCEWTLAVHPVTGLATSGWS